jgi:hypothetical protein
MHRTQTADRRRGFPTLLATIASLILVLAACGSAGAPEGLDGDQAPPANGGTGGEDRAPDEGSGDTDDGFAALVEQRIIKTGEVTLEVDNVGAAIGQVRALATRLGGYVGGSQAGTLDDRTTLTLRIPAARFDEALAELHELDAEVLAEATREEDVTTEIVDLEARIENLEASEATYRDLVARATKIEDILAVQSRLDEVRGQIEQMRAQLEAITGQADLSTLTVTFVPAAAPVTAQTEDWDPGAQVAAAVAALLGVGQGIVTGLIWLAIVIVPIALVAGLVALIVLRGGLELRRRVPPAATPPASGQET